MADAWLRSGVVGSTAFLAGAAAGFAFARSWYPESPSFRPAGVLSEIVIFPIKSCRGISVPEAHCSSLGLQFGDAKDRSFLVTDEKNHFITARKENRLILVQPSFHDGQLWLDAPGMDTLHVDIPTGNELKEEKCSIWGQTARGIDCGREVGEWLEKYLNRPKGSTKLMYHPWESPERIAPYWDKWDRFKKSDTCIFADLCPYMIVNDASVTDLNSRLDKAVTHRYFRPNFIVKNSLPYEEDAWKYVQVGDQCRFRCIRPCTRCIMTTIDPETGVPSTEPLKTLRSYRQLKNAAARRREGDSPVFGQNLGLDSGGIVRIGYPVFAAI